MQCALSWQFLPAAAVEGAAERGRAERRGEASLPLCSALRRLTRDSG